MNWKEKLNSKYNKASLYAIGTLLLTYLGIKLIDQSGAIASAAGGWLGKLTILLRPLLTGFVFSYLLMPLTGRLEGRLERLGYYRKKGRSARSVSVLLTLLLVVLGIILLLTVLIATLNSSFQMVNPEDFFNLISRTIEEINDFYNDFTKQIQELPLPQSDLNEYLRNFGTYFANGVKNFFLGTLTAVGTVKAFFSTGIFSIIFCIYFLLDWSRISMYWSRVLRVLCGRGVFKALLTVSQDADRVFSGYIRGQVIDALIMSVMVSLGLSLVGVKYAVIIGILTGISNLIPYLGPLIAYGLTIFICLVYGDFQRLAAGILVISVLQLVDANVINPRLLSSSIDIHPMLVVASLVVGGSLGGLLGMLLAVPVGAFLKIQFERLICYVEQRKGMSGAETKP